MTVRSNSLIRGFDKARHMEGLRQCLIELQDFERRLDPRMPSGAELVEPYLEQMFERCNRGGGRFLIAEVDGSVAGYTTILPKVKSEELEDGNFEYALVADLVVLEQYRGQGLGGKLLKAAEQYARACKCRYLRIGVLAGNDVAERLYTKAGFSPRHIELEKVLTRS